MLWGYVAMGIHRGWPTSVWGRKGESLRKVFLGLVAGQAKRESSDNCPAQGRETRMAAGAGEMKLG